MITKYLNNEFLAFFYCELETSICECNLYLDVSDISTREYYANRLKWLIELKKYLKNLEANIILPYSRELRQKAVYRTAYIYNNLVSYYGILKNPYKKAWIKEMMLYFEERI